MTSTRQARRDAKQLYRFCVVDGTLDDDRVRQVVNGLIAAQRRRCPAILGQLLRLIKIDRSQHTARIESATPIPQELVESTKARLTQLYGPGLLTQVFESPSLVGGMRIQVGSDVYDGSIRGRLADLAKRF